jgi:hypothetical protein
MAPTIGDSINPSLLIVDVPLCGELSERRRPVCTPGLPVN